MKDLSFTDEILLVNFYTDSHMFSYSPLAAAHFFNKSFSSSAANEQRKTDLKFTDLSDYFFVSHPLSGQREGSEHKRIMYFHPTDEIISKKIEFTGMSEAIVNFTNGLSKMDTDLTDDGTYCRRDFNFRYITSTYSKEVVLVVEEGKFIIGASFNKRNCIAKDYFPHLPTICSLLVCAYNAYKLLYGSFASRFLNQSVEFQQTLDRFFTPFLHLYRVNKVPLVDLFNGVDFLAVDNVNFLQIDCLYSSRDSCLTGYEYRRSGVRNNTNLSSYLWLLKPKPLEAYFEKHFLMLRKVKEYREFSACLTIITNCINEFSCIKNGLFFYQERLVHYSVSKKDLSTLCRFIIQTLISSAVQNEVSPQPPLSYRRASIRSARNGFFVDGSILVDYLGELTEHSFPKVFLHDSDTAHSSLTAFEIVAYRVRSATACFLVHADEMSRDKFAEFIENLADFVDEKIVGITSQMEADVPLLTHNQSDIPYHFIYFNPDSLSLRKSFPSYTIPGQSKTSVALIPPQNIHRLTFETYDRFAANPDEFAQIFLKADSDWWIVFKRIERRILVLFILQTVATSIVDIEFYVENIVNSAPFKILFIPQ